MRARLYRVRVNRSGYDDRGNYWGVGTPLYAYTYFVPGDGEQPLRHVRAGDRNQAKQFVMRDDRRVTDFYK